MKPDTRQSGIGKPFQSGSDTLRWVECPERMGLRFVGFADKLVRNAKHTGWYCDEFQDRTLRGVVYQLTGKAGRARYVYGYTSSDDCYKVSEPNGAALNLSDVTLGNGTEEDTQARRDVAMWADNVAERAAEAERDYQAAWSAGAHFTDTLYAVTALEAERRALLAEIRAMTPACKREHPAAFRAAEGRLRDVRAAIADARETLHKLATGAPVHRDGSGYWYMTRTNVPAFLDGAGVSSVRKLPRFAAIELRPYLAAKGDK